MGALAPLSLWTSQDDALLKNAMEAGNSLESLAKGAVQFSKKFTLEELEGRWCSQLNNPAVSVKASGQIVNHEHPPSTLSPISHALEFKGGEKSATGKRKNDIPQNFDSSVLKRFRKNVDQSRDEPPYVDPTIGGEAIQNRVSDCEILHLSLVDFDFEVADLLLDHNGIQMSTHPNFEENHTLVENCFWGEEVGHPKDMSVCTLFDAGDFKDAYSVDQQLSTDDYLARLSECLMDFTNEEELFPEADGEYIYDLSSLLSDSSGEDKMVNLTVSEASISQNEHLNIPDGVNPEKLYDEEAQILPSTPAMDPEFPDEHLNIPEKNSDKEAQILPSIPALSPEFPDQHPNIPEKISDKEAQKLPSIPYLNPKFPRLCNGVICCVLNTEDLEVPCNDDALIPSQTKSSKPSARKILEAKHPFSAAMKKSMIEEKSNGKPYLSSQVIQSQILTELGIHLPFIKSTNVNVDDDFTNEEV